MRGAYTYQLFKAGLDENLEVNGSPHYVLIRIGPQSRFVCVQGSFLEGAIHFEYNLPFDAKGTLAARGIAKKHWNKPFTFRNAKALKNVEPTYSEENLKFARKEVTRIIGTKNAVSSREARILTGLVYSDMDRVEDFARVEAYRDALAYALLERGILVGVSDNTSGLYIDLGSK